MEFLPVSASAPSDCLALFSTCFPSSSICRSDYIDWLYRLNPDGEVVGFNAYDGTTLAAHYVCIPARAMVGGQVVKVLLSLNTATHPSYQGKGLFTKLADLTYHAGASMGFDAVYGVANANSTPGFTRKLGFQLIGPLRSTVGLGPLGLDFGRLPDLQFQRLWDSEALTWRCNSPLRPLTVRQQSDRLLVLSPALLGGACMAAAELQGTSLSFDVRTQISGRFASPLRLFLGCIPPSAQRRSCFVDIPHRFRPSPLNLIYRSLSGRVNAIDPEAVLFNFLDFDAY